MQNLNSVNTNASAFVALQNLNATSTSLTQTQNRISTGLKVSSAKDDGATWAIAQNQRSQISSLDAVKDSLSRGSSTVDVALSAGETVSDLLTQLKTKALAASDVSLDTTARGALNEDFKALRDQITKIVTNADFNGKNLLASGSTALFALANASGASKVTVNAEVLSLGGSIVTLGATASFATATAAATLVNTVASSLTNVNAAVARLGTSSKKLALQSDFVGKLSDALTAGVGNLVDADLAKESAKLQALQTRQQLGVQALSIANQAPQSLLSLFK